MLDYNIRLMQNVEYHLLSEFCYQAIYTDAGEQKPCKSILNFPDIKKYYDNYALSNQKALLVICQNQAIAAIWGNLFNFQNKGFGYYSDDYIEISMSVMPDFRGKGVGSKLLHEYINMQKDLSSVGLSLSVAKQNYAVNMYYKHGFKLIKTREYDLLMALSLK